MTSRNRLVLVVVLCQLLWASVSKEIPQKAEKRFNIRGKEWVTAQNIINQLVDESIANRVTEAEHDIEHLLEANIANHIKSTGKTLLRRISKECADKIEHCQALAKSGVCKTSRQAMRKHCAKTCNLCEEHFVDVTPHVALKSKAKAFVKKPEPQTSGTVRVKTSKYHNKIKIVSEKPRLGQSSKKNNLSKFGQTFVPEDTIRILHSIEPLLSQQSKGVMKFHENDLGPENEKIRDAQKLLEYVKVLQAPSKLKHKLKSASEDFNQAKKHNSEDEDDDEEDDEEDEKQNKKEDEHDEENLHSLKGEGKDQVKKGEKATKKDKPKAKGTLPKVADKAKEDNSKVIPKPKIANSAAKSRVTKKKLKLKGTPLTSLSKTVTYKNHQYKITPVVDWEKISKMLESLGYKAVHIVGVKDTNIHKDLADHLKKHGVHRIIGSKTKVHKVAAETFVPAVHREKSWHNDEYFKAHCHPMCLKKCVSSCETGCCPEHDKVSVKTGLAKHCHPSCITECIPSCGSGCCSAAEELKRGHHFLHYQKIQDYHKAQDQANQDKKEKDIVIAKQNDEPKKKHDKQNSQCHPQCKETCIGPCGKGCCSDEAEKHREEQEKKNKDELEKKRKQKEKDRAKAKEPEEGEHDQSIQELYKPQPRLCPSPCPTVCAPSCADACCSFGSYSQSVTGAPLSREQHPGFMPNVPYPHSKVIPVDAYACKESCKFSCTYDCPRDCCQPEELALQASHETAALSSPTTVGALQTMGYQGMLPESATCPSPCPGNCFPSCTVACCTSALGLPQEENTGFGPVARSSTNRVLHVTHLVRPITGLNGCPISCASHCTPACARSGCCDSSKRKRRGSSRT